MALSRERIIEVALAVVEQEGWDALSMRRLAQELDVWPMAVYRYFQDKDALAEGLVDAAAAKVELPARRGSWRARLSSLLRGARAALRWPSSTLAVGADRALLTPSGERISEAGLDLLAEGGLRGEEAATAWRALFGYAVGFPAVDGEDRGEFDYGLERLLDGIESSS
jgi:AcrR family transcriptional regulator